MISLTKAVSVILPLASLLVYKLDVKTPHTTIPCGIFNVGCLTADEIPIQGFVDKEYDFVKDIFVNNFIQGLDVGASISAYVDGKQVLSLQGGWQDIEKGIPYTNETLQMVFSSTKALAAVITARLVENGDLSYDEYISTYWPEFAQGNKENVKLTDLMRHTSGVGALDNPLTFEEVTDPDILSDILARQTHQFGGEPLHSYHAVSQGLYLKEVIKRADPEHRTIDDFAQILNREYNIEWYLKPAAQGSSVDPNRISKFYTEPTYKQIFGLLKVLLDPRVDSSLARSVFDKTSPYYRSIVNPTIDQVQPVEMSNSRYRVIENSAYSGYSNADSLAKIAAMMANKGKAIVEGEPNLLESDEIYNDATKSVPGEIDQLFNFVIYNQRGGFMEFRDLNLSDKNAFFEGGCGAGGSLILYNKEYNIAFAYVMNAFTGRISPDERTIPMIESIFEHVKNKRNANN
ncbi:beta-lactamase/transpeptidase-like protein [Backusella circina FSU 941]|nr:beta-lactamase/transpeptidase-like protein [Backusella circina FSU 941]